MKQCLECGISFAPVSSRHKFHTYNCQARFNAKRKRLKRQEQGLCPQCGKPNDFPARTRRHVSDRNKSKITYCSQCAKKFQEYHQTLTTKENNND